MSNYEENEVIIHPIDKDGDISIEIDAEDSYGEYITADSYVDFKSFHAWMHEQEKEMIPFWKHDYSDDILIGKIEFGGERYDLYYRDNADIITLKARYEDKGCLLANIKCLSPHPALLIAKVLYGDLKKCQ